MSRWVIHIQQLAACPPEVSNPVEDWQLTESQLSMPTLYPWIYLSLSSFISLVAWYESGSCLNVIYFECASHAQLLSFNLSGLRPFCPSQGPCLPCSHPVVIPQSKRCHLQAGFSVFRFLSLYNDLIWQSSWLSHVRLSLSHLCPSTSKQRIN